MVTLVLQLEVSFNLPVATRRRKPRLVNTLMFVLLITKSHLRPVWTYLAWCFASGSWRTRLCRWRSAGGGSRARAVTRVSQHRAARSAPAGSPLDHRLSSRRMTSSPVRHPWSGQSPRHPSYKAWSVCKTFHGILPSQLW